MYHQRHSLWGLRVYEKQLNPTVLPMQIEYSLNHCDQDVFGKNLQHHLACALHQKTPRKQEFILLHTEIIFIALASLDTTISNPHC